MIKVTLENNQTVYLSKDAIMEICPVQNPDLMKIHTAKNEYIIQKSELQQILADIEDKSTRNLTSAIRSLTNMIRARVH